ncbi:MAG: helix-hairpin-helix domain-containing protein [Lactobacillus sp.]|jgi:competence protein ComEA|nr:helix-hairpin-helix domain-containing protein [Lactobacillus sp.]
MNFEKGKNWVLEHRSWLMIAGLGLFLLVGWMFNQRSVRQAKREPVITQQPQMRTTKKTSHQTKTRPYVTCDIAGAVKDQGVYTLKKGARMSDLIEAAGGLDQKAALKAINRSVVLRDQDKIYIPYQGEKEADTNASTVVNSNQSSSANASSATSGETGKVHLNSASKEELQKLTGIGEKKAEQIISYREQKGGFKKIEEITEVSGIGEKTFAGFKDQLAL